MPHEEPQYKSEEWEHLDHEQAARTTQKLRQSLDRELDRKLRKLQRRRESGEKQRHVYEDLFEVVSDSVMCYLNQLSQDYVAEARKFDSPPSRTFFKDLHAHLFWELSKLMPDVGTQITHHFWFGRATKPKLKELKDSLKDRFEDEIPLDHDIARHEAQEGHKQIDEESRNVSKPGGTEGVSEDPLQAALEAGNQKEAVKDLSEQISNASEFNPTEWGKELCIVVSYSKAGKRNLETLAKMLTNKARIKYPGGKRYPYPEPVSWHREAYKGFKDHLSYLRRQARKDGMWDSIPANYYLSYISHPPKV